MSLRTYEKVQQTAGGLFEPILKVKDDEGKGVKVDLGVFPSARLAAVAHDVARLVYINCRRPGTDLAVDQGLHHPADGYLVDPTFKSLLSGGASFADVCGLLKSGALADQFLCSQDRTTRKATSSNTSGGDRSALSRQLSRLAPPAEQQRSQQHMQQQQRAEPPPQQQQEQQQKEQQKAPELKASSFQSPAAASLQAPPAAAAAGSPRRRQSKWMEWPSKSGQFCSVVTAAALKGNMAVPAKIKKDLFQCKGAAAAQVMAHDLAQGSGARWAWEVRDQVFESKTTVHLSGLGPFFKHYQAAAGDVVVAVASAPSAVKAAVWKGNSQDAARFKAHAERHASRQAGGGAGKKRAAEDSATRQQAAKAAKAKQGASAPAAAAAAADDVAAAAAEVVAATAAQRQASSSPDASRQLSKSSSLPQPHLQHGGLVKQLAAGSPLPPVPSEQQQQQQQQPTAQQPTAPQQEEQEQERQKQRQQEVSALVALAEQGVDPASCDDTMAASPTAQVAQSPFRRQQALLPPVFASTNQPAIKQEHVSPPPQPLEAAGAATHAAAGAGGATAPAANHSPARMSCADRQPQGAAGAAGAAGEGSGGVPDPYHLYRAMKGAVRECGLPAEQRHAFWLAFMRWAPWQQRIAADEVADMQADGPAWREELRAFIQHELRLTAPALLPGGAPGDASGGAP